MNYIKSSRFLSLAISTIIMLFSLFSEARHSNQWQYEDEIHFTDRKTAVAIRNCQRERQSDFRCSARAYRCDRCSTVKHSDHSSYVVYRRAGGRPPRVERRLVDTIDFYHRKTAKARRNCERARRQTWECNSSGYECTPCTIESHTDHSEFSIYELIRNRRGGGHGRGRGGRGGRGQGGGGRH